MKFLSLIRCGHVIPLLTNYSSILKIGKGTPIRRGLGAISMLKWSPSGDYFLTAKLYGLLLIQSSPSAKIDLKLCPFFHYFSDGTFYLWETNTWTSEPWSSTGGYLTVSDVMQHNKHMSIGLCSIKCLSLLYIFS